MSTRNSTHQIAASITFLMAIASCASAEVTDESAWTVGVDDSISYETVKVMSQSSLTSIPDEYAENNVNPVLELRCTEGAGGELSMQIDWQRFISSFKTEAGFEVDEGDQTWIDLSVDGSNKITLSRSAADVQTVVDAISGGDKLAVEIIPYSESSVVVEYDLAGFDTALEQLRSGC